MHPRWRFALVPVLLAAAAALIAHVRVFAFVTDDAFISFVYARNLAEHGQLVFNLGERVEGYTNFLWTIFLAGWMRLGWEPESSSIAWGCSFAVATMGVLAWLSRRLRGDGRWSPWDALPALILAAVPGYACWSGGGLETQMFTFWLTLGSALYLTEGPRASLASGAAFGLAALTRPEGNLFFALALLHRSIGILASRRLRPRRDELAWVGMFLVLVVPHFLWRRAYYGWWLPNTFYIKSSGGMGAWGRGLYYVRRYLEAFLLPVFYALPVLALPFRRTAGENRLYRYLLLVVPVFLLYVVSVGGDFMGLFRFALPVVPLVVLGAAMALRTILGALSARTSPGAAAAIQSLAVALLLGGYAWNAARVDRKALTIGADNGIDTPGFLRWYTADRAAIGRWFGEHRQPDDYAAVGGAGAQVYYSRIPSLDCFGLSDEHIAHNVPPVSNRPGHQKYAPVDYQLSRKPTIITSNYYRIGPAPEVPGDAPFWRGKGYHYVSVRIPGLSSPWYTFLKRMDRSVGPLGPIDAEMQ